MKMDFSKCQVKVEFHKTKEFNNSARHVFFYPRGVFFAILTACPKIKSRFKFRSEYSVTVFLLIVPNFKVWLKAWVSLGSISVAKQSVQSKNSMERFQNLQMKQSRLNLQTILVVANQWHRWLLTWLLNQHAEDLLVQFITQQVGSGMHQNIRPKIRI